MAAGGFNVQYWTKVEHVAKPPLMAALLFVDCSSDIQRLYSDAFPHRPERPKEATQAAKYKTVVALGPPYRLLAAQSLSLAFVMKQTQYC